MKIQLTFVATICAATLVACAAPAPAPAPAPALNLSDPQAIAREISIQHDDFKKITSYTGPEADINWITELFIRAWKDDKTGIFAYQIYVKDYYEGDWRIYDSAYDSEGNSLDVTQISRQVESCRYSRCSHYEHLGINITREYLEKNQESGIRFKVIGRAGEEIFTIPSAYIKAFLSIAR